ncbi:hypothetical protein OAE72_00715 [Akkermansiaceae bacterium]|jgi:hypothetical protein|nr:hypothetical protein [Akkermansiaceae bacterium]
MSDRELEKYYRSFEEMFRSDGWKNLMEDIKGSADNVNSVEACKDDKDLYFRKGQLVVMANMLNLEAQIETAKEQQQDEVEVDVD